MRRTDVGASEVDKFLLSIHSFNQAMDPKNFNFRLHKLSLNIGKMLALLFSENPLPGDIALLLENLLWDNNIPPSK